MGITFCECQNYLLIQILEKNRSYNLRSDDFILTNRNSRFSKKSLKIPKGGNQNTYIEEEQTIQWPREKVQQDKQRFTKHTHKTKDRVTRDPLKTGGELRYSGRVSSSCSTSGTHRVNLRLGFTFFRHREVTLDEVGYPGQAPLIFMLPKTPICFWL